MDNKKQFRHFIHALVAFIVVFAVFTTTAGAIRTGELFHIICGVLNLLTLYPLIKSLVKYITED